MKPLYIFDLDGTLALIEHRRHHVSDGKSDWRAFFAACVDDAPNSPVIQTMNYLYEAGCEILIWSGRSDEVYGQTMEWLSRHFCGFHGIRMRRAGDHQPDEKLKAGWLAELNAVDRGRLLAVFEDRDRMVKLWRENGIACFQVAPGDF